MRNRVRILTRRIIGVMASADGTLFGPAAVMAGPDLHAHPIEQPWLLRTERCGLALESMPTCLLGFDRDQVYPIPVVRRDQATQADTRGGRGGRCLLPLLARV